MPLVDTQLPQTSPVRAVENILDDLFWQCHTRGADAAFDARVEAGYRKFHGVEFPREMLADNAPGGRGKVTPMALMGPPGHGKTTSFKVAAKKFCDLVGMNFVANPDDEYKLGKNDFLFVSHELSGQMTATDFVGIPNRVVENVEGEEVEYMSKLPNKRFALLGKAQAGMLLMDDFTNAAPPIQNVLLSFLQEGRFQGLNLGNTYRCVTGNLGSKDFTNVSPMSSAIVSRTSIWYTEDSLREFVSRAAEIYNDSHGDAYVSMFLRDKAGRLAGSDVGFTEHFSKLPSAKGEPFPCPRNWDQFICRARRWFVAKGESVMDPARSGLAVGELQSLAASYVGQKAASEYAAFVRGISLGAVPIARGFMNDQGGISPETQAQFSQRYGKDARGSMGDQEEFGFHFAITLADEVIKKLAEDPERNFKHAMERFGTGLFRLTPSLVSIGVEYLSSRLPHSVPSMSESITVAGQAKPWVHINFDTSAQMTKIFATCPGNEGKLQAATRVLSQASKYSADYQGNGTVKAKATR